MKSYFLTYFALGFILFSTSCNSGGTDAEKQALLEKGEAVGNNKKANSAIEFNDGIVGLQSIIITEMLQVMKLESPDPVASMKHLIQTIKTSKTNLNDLETYEGGEDLKAEALALFSFYEEICSGPWLEAFQLYADKGANMSEEDSNKFVTLLESGGDRETKLDESFMKAQDAFAAHHGFVTTKNAFQDEIDAAAASVESE